MSNGQTRMIGTKHQPTKPPTRTPKPVSQKRRDRGAAIREEDRQEEPTHVFHRSRSRTIDNCQGGDHRARFEAGMQRIAEAPSPVNSYNRSNTTLPVRMGRSPDIELLGGFNT